MRTKLQFLFYLCLLITYSATAQTRHAGIEQFLKHPGLKHASVGICVKDMTGKQINAHNAEKMYTPASVLKLVTTATALELLGGEYRYETTLAKDKNNENTLLIHGYGDPTLGTKFLDNSPEIFLSQWTDQISRNFDSTKILNITVIDDYFGYNGISQRWIYQDMGNYYGSGSYGISIFDNTFEIFYNTTRRDTFPEIIRTEPEVDIIFKNMLELNESGKDNSYILGEPLSDRRLLAGNIPAGKTAFSVKGDIPNPGLTLGKTLGRKLTEKGYTIGYIENNYDNYSNNLYSKSKNKFDENVFYSHKSFPLKDIIKDTNVRSNNHYAEHLIRTVGRTRNKDIYSAPLEEGTKKTAELWKARGLDTDALIMFDGSGLSPSNSVSPSFMCDLLIYMQTKSKNSTTFLESLPKAGREGTVKSRLKGTKLDGKIYMKSGSIFGVQCFSGYYINGDKKYAFTVMVNKFTGQRAQITRVIDTLLLSLF